MAIVSVEGGGVSVDEYVEGGGVSGGECVEGGGVSGGELEGIYGGRSGRQW